MQKTNNTDCKGKHKLKVFISTFTNFLQAKISKRTYIPSFGCMTIVLSINFFFSFKKIQNIYIDESRGHITISAKPFEQET